MTNGIKAAGEQKTTLLIGFDSAWTAHNSGAILGVRRWADGKFDELGPPQIVDYVQAEAVITKWQAELTPTATIVLLDQPTIVPNTRGQRPVENIVGCPVSLRYGGMQPASASREEMFGSAAPVWRFLNRFGGAANPTEPVAGNRVFETYPVLALIALGWTLPDLSQQARPAGRMPKYNPERRKTFFLLDWQHVCERAHGAFQEHKLAGIAEWIDNAGRLLIPTKPDQDRLDACICLLVALHLAEGKDCLMVGNLESGYIVVPHSAMLHAELDARCRETGREASEWVRKLLV